MKKATKLNFCAFLYRNAIILVLSNGFSIGCIVSVLLHLILPFDAVDNVDADSASKMANHVNPREAQDLTHQKVSWPVKVCPFCLLVLPYHTLLVPLRCLSALSLSIERRLLKLLQLHL